MGSDRSFYFRNAYLLDNLGTGLPTIYKYKMGSVRKRKRNSDFRFRFDSLRIFVSFMDWRGLYGRKIFGHLFDSLRFFPISFFSRSFRRFRIEYSKIIIYFKRVRFGLFFRTFRFAFTLRVSEIPGSSGKRNRRRTSLLPGQYRLKTLV